MQAFADTRKGVPRPPKVKANMLAAAERRVGSTHKDESRAKTSESMKRRWEAYRADPEKLEARVAKMQRGVPRSDETKAKISAGNMGKKLSPEHRAKLSNKVVSEETRAKCRQLRSSGSFRRMCGRNRRNRCGARHIHPRPRPKLGREQGQDRVEGSTRQHVGGAEAAPSRQAPRSRPARSTLVGATRTASRYAATSRPRLDSMAAELDTGRPRRQEPHQAPIPGRPASWHPGRRSLALAARLGGDGRFRADRGLGGQLTPGACSARRRCISSRASGASAARILANATQVVIKIMQLRE